MNDSTIILPEITAVGIYNSQLAVKNRTITKNRTTTMFEIEIPIEKGGISYINSNAMPIDTNLLICAKPGQIRHTRLPFKCYYVHMTVTEGILYHILMNTPDFFVTKNPKQYFALFEKLNGYYNSSSVSDSIMLTSLLLQLIYFLRDETIYKSSRYKANKEYDLTIEKAISFIQQNLSEQITLKKTAAHVALSPVYFHNCFKAAVGKTLHEYVEDLRIRKALDLLTTTDQTLAEIAYQCGFSSQSYFSYAFKRKMNMTPREYTRELYDRYHI